MKRIGEYAAKKNIRLGVEGRRGYEEIPSERELPALLDELNSPQFGYWHDMGHIQIKENLGFVITPKWLRQIGPRAFGCHLQDCHLARARSPTAFPASSISRILSRSCPRTACIRLGNESAPNGSMKSAYRSRFGNNDSENEKNSAHSHPVARHRGGALLGVSRSRRAKMAIAFRAADYPWIARGYVFPGHRDRGHGALENPAPRPRNRPEVSPANAALFLIGMFFNQFLPGGTGGDIVKTVPPGKRTPDKMTGALLAVLVRPIIGLIALMSSSPVF